MAGDYPRNTKLQVNREHWIVHPDAREGRVSVGDRLRGKRVFAVDRIEGLVQLISEAEWNKFMYG